MPKEVVDIAARQRSLKRFLTCYNHLDKTELIEKAKEEKIYHESTTSKEIYDLIVRFAKHNKIVIHNKSPQRINPVKPLESFKRRYEKVEKLDNEISDIELEDPLEIKEEMELKKPPPLIIKPKKDTRSNFVRELELEESLLTEKLKAIQNLLSIYNH